MDCSILPYVTIQETCLSQKSPPRLIHLSGHFGSRPDGQPAMVSGPCSPSRPVTWWHRGRSVSPMHAAGSSLCEHNLGSWNDSDTGRLHRNVPDCATGVHHLDVGGREALCDIHGPCGYWVGAFRCNDGRYVNRNPSTYRLNKLLTSIVSRRLLHWCIFKSGPLIWPCCSHGGFPKLPLHLLVRPDYGLTSLSGHLRFFQVLQLRGGQSRPGCGDRSRSRAREVTSHGIKIGFLLQKRFQQSWETVFNT